MRLGNGKRVKWEPGAAMVIVLGLGLWLALGPASGPRFALEEGSSRQEIRIGNTRGILETVSEGGEGAKFRVHMQGRPGARELDGAGVRELFGERVYAEAMSPGRNVVFQWLNITSWVNLVWVGIGLGGQVLFSGRMLLQWLVSEKLGKSVISESFWWFSLFGAVMLFSYFVWRQDPVGILGQATGVVIYARNLRLIHKQKRRAARAGAVGAAVIEVE